MGQAPESARCRWQAFARIAGLSASLKFFIPCMFAPPARLALAPASVFCLPLPSVCRRVVVVVVVVVGSSSCPCRFVCFPSVILRNCHCLREEEPPLPCLVLGRCRGPIY